MDAFQKLPEELKELVQSLRSAAVVGDLQTAGITQYTLFMLVACVAMLIVVLAFKRRQASAEVPHGFFVNAVEYGIEYVRDDILKGILGSTWRVHFPFLMTVFFFVLFNNLIGIIPGARPGTGTISATAAVALMSFVYFIHAGCKAKGVLGYIKSLAPDELMLPIKVLVWLIEVFSIFLRLITLAVRLFCNMYAGHIVMGTFALLTSLCATALVEHVSAAAFASTGISVIWLAVLIMIYAVEMLVAVVQAYVFTLLSAVYVQLAEEKS